MDSARHRLLRGVQGHWEQDEDRNQEGGKSKGGIMNLEETNPTVHHITADMVYPAAVILAALLLLLSVSLL